MKDDHLSVLEITQLFLFCLLAFLRFDSESRVRAAVRCQASQKKKRDGKDTLQALNLNCTVFIKQK